MGSYSFILGLLFLAGASLAEVSIKDLSPMLSELPDIDALAVLKDTCDQRGGPGTFDKIKDAKPDLKKCVSGMINITKFDEELQASMKTGSMEEVFGKYCAKKPDIQACITSFTDTVKPCLDDREKDALNLTLSIMDQLVEFACYRDGDRMAMFVAEGGIECIKSQTEGIKRCVNETFHSQVENAEVNDVNSLSDVLFSKERCNDLGRLQTCVVGVLEKCEDSTPANVIEAVFKFVKKRACPTPKRKRSIFKRSILTETSVNHLQKTKVMLANICTLYGTGNAATEFSNTFDNGMGCYRRSLSSLSGDKEKAFAEIKSKFHECVDPIFDKFADCVPENMKFLGDYYKGVFDSGMDLGLKYKDDLNDSEFTKGLTNCVQKVQTSHTLELVSCFQQSSNMNFRTITKPEFCGFVKKSYTCIGEIAHRVCSNDFEPQQIIDDFVKATTSPCSA